MSILDSAIIRPCDFETQNKIVSLLIKYVDDLHFRPYYLHEAVTTNNFKPDMVKILLQNGISVSTKFDDIIALERIRKYTRSSTRSKNP